MELNLTPRYLLIPRKRVEGTVSSGAADLVCDLRPEWIDSRDWQWSAAVFTNHMIVAQLDGTAPIKQLQQLKHMRIGTVLGYRYPELEGVLVQLPGGASRKVLSADQGKTWG